MSRVKLTGGRHACIRGDEEDALTFVHDSLQCISEGYQRGYEIDVCQDALETLQRYLEEQLSNSKEGNEHALHVRFLKSVMTLMEEDMIVEDDTTS